MSRSWEMNSIARFTSCLRRDRRRTPSGSSYPRRQSATVASRAGSRRGTNPPPPVQFGISQPIAFCLANLAGSLALSAAAQGQSFSLERDDLVRTDAPGLRAVPDMAQIVDAAPTIVKESFRILQSSEYHPTEVYVRFKPRRTASQREAAHREAQVSAQIWQSRIVPNLYKVKVGEFDVAQTVGAYLDVADVLYAEPNYSARPTWEPNDPEWDDLWGMTADEGSRAEWAWDEFQGNSQTMVAIIDSGIHWPHPDLVSNIWHNPGEIDNGIDDDQNGYVDDLRGWDFVYEDADVVPDTGNHGTHVAGTVGAAGNNGIGVAGVNWRCRLMALKCGALDGFLYDMNDALDYAVAAGARVSNNSYGSSSYSQVMYDTILAAQAFGHVFVAAAGNDSQNVDEDPKYPACYDLSNIITVAAIDDDGDLADFSNYGRNQVDLGAPGVDVLSTVGFGDYDEKQGTSMASPHVAGAVALTLGRHPELTWSALKDRIMGSTIQLESLGGITVTGGSLNVPTTLGVWIQPGGWMGVGTFGAPFGGWQMTTLGFGITPPQGTLNLKSGTISYDDLLGITSFNKPMTLQAHDGVVRIGE